MSIRDQFILAVIIIVVMLATVVPDGFYGTFGTHSGHMVSSDCPPERAKEHKAACLQGPFAGTKVEDKVSDAVGKFDDQD